MPRWLLVFALPLLLAGLAACGGGGDDDDDDDSGDDDAGSEDSGGSRTDASGGTGSLTVAGKEYKLDVETCELGKKDELTVIAASLEGEKDADFSASGIANMVAIAARVGDKGYIAVAAELKIDGKSVSWDGDLYEPSNPAKAEKGKFSLKC